MLSPLSEINQVISLPLPPCSGDVAVRIYCILKPGQGSFCTAGFYPARSCRTQEFWRNLSLNPDGPTLVLIQDQVAAILHTENKTNMYFYDIYQILQQGCKKVVFWITSFFGKSYEQLKCAFLDVLSKILRVQQHIFKCEF